MMSKQNPSRRTFLKTTGVLATIGIGSTIPASAETGIPDAVVPDDTDGLTYATMGTDPNNPTATVYGNFKCPYTQKFVREGNLEAVLNEYVKTGEMNLRFRALAYQPPGTTSHGTSTYYISDSDPLISEAALSVWDVSPDDYWQFFNYMFSDLISGNVSLSEMQGRMQTAGVSDRGTIIDRASSGQFDNTVEKNRYSAGDYGVTFTPTMVFDGETIAPHHDTDHLLNWIGNKLSGASNFSPDESSDSENSSEDTDSNETSDSTESGDTQASNTDENSSSEASTSGSDEDPDQSSESSMTASSTSKSEETSTDEKASMNEDDNTDDRVQH